VGVHFHVAKDGFANVGKKLVQDQISTSRDGEILDHAVRVVEQAGLRNEAKDGGHECVSFLSGAFRLIKFLIYPLDGCESMLEGGRSIVDTWIVLCDMGCTEPQDCVGEEVEL
jgi:hypothetical protein